MKFNKLSIHNLLLLSIAACSSGSKFGGKPSTAPDTLAAQIEGETPTGNHDAITPITTSLTVSFDQVATEMKIPKDRLVEQTQYLANFMRTGTIPSLYCKDDEDPNTEQLCSFLSLVRDENPTGWVSNDTTKGRKVAIKPQHFSEQQKLGYGRLLRSLHKDTANRVLAWVPKMLAVNSCPRNLSAAAIRKLEHGLPSESVRPAMEKLYSHASACLQVSDEGYETTHLRQALLRYHWKMHSAARESVQKALLAKDSGERSRVLYWAGRLEPDPVLKQAHWDRLIEQYPLSFHALEIFTHKQIDPYQLFTSRAPISLERRFPQREDIDIAVRWLEALYIRGFPEAGQRLSRFIGRFYKGDLSPNLLMYISSLKTSTATPLNTITFLTRQVNENPAILNAQTLKMLFPRPYYDIFSKASPNTDTLLVMSVARQESAFNPQARSTANARGLLQILPTTARVLSGKKHNDLYDEETNAQLGVKFLSQLIDRFGGSVEMALAGYNAGPGRVPEWKERFTTDEAILFLDLIPFKETRNYVANINRNNYWYERLYGASNKNTSDPNREAASAQQRSQWVAQTASTHREFKSTHALKVVEKVALQQNPTPASAARPEDGSEGAGEHPAPETPSDETNSES